MVPSLVYTGKKLRKQRTTDISKAELNICCWCSVEAFHSDELNDHHNRFFHREIRKIFFNLFWFGLILYVPVNNFSVMLGRVFLG